MMIRGNFLSARAAIGQGHIVRLDFRSVEQDSKCRTIRRSADRDSVKTGTTALGRIESRILSHPPIGSTHDNTVITMVLRDCLYWKMKYLGNPRRLHGFKIN